MSYFKVESSLTADASDINDNFYYFNQGSILPRDETDASFGSIDLTNNIGSSVATWNTLYCKDFSTDLSSISSNYKLWALVAETTLSTTVSSIEITGLNGDDIEEYIVFIKFILPAYGGGSSLERMYINNDSGSNYYYVRVQADGVNTFAAGSEVTGAGILLYNQVVSNTESSSFGQIKIRSKTGLYRNVIIQSSGRVYQKSVGNVATNYSVWNNTVDTITSISFHSNFHITAGSYFYPNSNIQIWGRK